MQYFRSKVGEFGSLLESHSSDPPGFWDKGRICRHHAVNIGPDLHRLSFGQRRYQCCRVVGTSPPESGAVPLQVAADEALHHSNNPFRNEGGYEGVDPLLRLGYKRPGPTE